MKKENIIKHIKTNGVSLEFFDCIDSTNDYLKNAAKNGAPDKTVVIATKQTAGKGTRNRSFISDVGGVYLSLLVKADFSVINPTLITPLTAVAVCDAIGEISPKTPKIKWVNDVYLCGKKVCGILCETVTLPGNSLPYVVVGIGINFSKPKDGLRQEIKDIATYIFEQPNDALAEQFVARLLDCFFAHFAKISEKAFLPKYRSESLVIGEKIIVSDGMSETEALALEIDDECRLVVQLPDKTRKTLCSGDVSIKL